MQSKEEQSELLNSMFLLDVPDTLPLIPIRDMVIFPNAILPLVVGRDKSLAAIEAAETSPRYIFLVSQKDPDQEEVRSRDLYRVGTVARILQTVHLTNNYRKVVIESLARARATRIYSRKNFFRAKIDILVDPEQFPSEQFPLLGELKELFNEYLKENPELPEELGEYLEKEEDPYRILDFVGFHTEAPLDQKQTLLETASPSERVKRTVEILKHSIALQQLRKQLDNQVRESMMQHQREYYLQEQLRIIKKELGEEEQAPPEIKKLEEEINKMALPEHARKKALEELDKLRRTPPFSPEYTVARNYLDWLLQLPWGKRTEDRLDIEEAKRILDEDHYGLEKPKTRILEHLAVLQRVKKMKGPILCFVGPPGVGKTSLGRSIARALGRNFVRISLGGVRDEAEIRGHRRTYIGSMPGKIIQSMKKAQSQNPVFLLDEVDKMSMDFRGDPSSALLEVLDPEQNCNFNDHYLDIDYDLSEVFFITTANVQANIPLPLQDRMEIIELPGYLEHEKIHIARRHLIPKQLQEHGLDQNTLEITDDAVLRIIREYTREAGVRNLEREIANICRKTTRRLVENPNLQKITVSGKNLEDFLGKPTYLFRQVEQTDEIGIATGLAWTPYGGDLLKIEANLFPGKGKMILTGKLGEVMKESAQTALSYLRSIAGELNIDPERFQQTDIHIHVPEGAIPKDGPSAGITLATALISAFSNRPVRGNIAMTGEITLRGKILAIGGLNEKLLAAQRNNIPTVLVPYENKKEVDDLPAELREGLEIVLVKHYGEVLPRVLK